MFKNNLQLLSAEKWLRYLRAYSIPIIQYLENVSKLILGRVEK